MAFPDNSASDIHSLLALLRSTQGAGPTPLAQSTTSVKANSSQYGQLPSQPPPVPSNQQLKDLLTSLNARPPPAPPRQSSDQARRELIEPFGPVLTASPSKSDLFRAFDVQGKGKQESSGSYENKSEETYARRSWPERSPSGARIRGENAREPGFAEMSFSRALPIISELLSDESFRNELRKMKKEQDSLERRLWAKMEKIKAEHESSIKAEKDIAKITRQPVPMQKSKGWARQVSTSLSNFHTQHCLPAIDGLAVRHCHRLQEIGVPGLGPQDGIKVCQDDKTRDRIKRIMDVLEGGLDD